MEPGGRKAGVKVANAAELVNKLKVAAVLTFCGLAVAVALQWPEIQRYLNMKRM